MDYSMDFIDGQGRIDHFDLMHCPNDSDAAAEARRALVRSSRADRVEVWERARRVAVVDRGVTAQPHDWIATGSPVNPRDRT